MTRTKTFLTFAVIIFGLLLTGPVHASPKTLSSLELTQKTAEAQIRNLLEPLLERFCREQCRLMNVNVAIDLAPSDTLAPGFDDEIKSLHDLAPSSARVKILINDKVGQISREKLVYLIQQYLDTLDYPVHIDTQIVHFPLPQGSEGRVGELREKVSKQFLSTIDELIRQFCPQSCLLTNFNLHSEIVNGEEAQYGASGEFFQDGDTAIRIKDLSATLLMDEALTPEEQSNILEMVRLKTTFFKNVSITSKSMKFPRTDLTSGPGFAGRGGPYRGLAGISSELQKSEAKSAKSEEKLETKHQTESKDQKESTTSNTSNSNSSDSKQEVYQRFEKIERVENGDAVQAELQKFKVFGLLFACSVIALLIFIAISNFRPSQNNSGGVHRIIQQLTADPATSLPATPKASEASSKDNTQLSKRYEIERLQEELTSIYAQQPRVAKQVFSRFLTEEGVEATAECIHVFGEGIVIDMLRDPSLQTDLAELMEYYAKNPLELSDEEKLDLLRKLHSRTVTGKLTVMGSRSSNLFDFLAEMDGMQILELIRTESLTVKSIVLTQCDPQKRASIYTQLDPDIRMNLLAELSRIDYLPRDFIFNVAIALKRKKKENPRLNTEALPGSEVLVSLLERTGHAIQKTVVKNLEYSNPDSARTVKSKLVSIDTLKYLRDGQLLEVILSLKHDELIQFLKGAPEDIRKAIFSKSPKDLVVELEEELVQASALSRETYQTIERKILNRMKIMANEGVVNLIETNERMFSENPADTSFVKPAEAGQKQSPTIKKVSGW